MVSHFVDQHVAKVETAQPDQIGQAKRIGMKKHTRPLVVAVKSGGIFPALQLLGRSRQDEDRAESLEKF